uniref:Uncharacterized protein n=1 Tax=Nomascus leucogenys TaxID=61853 RepID=A0A2I3HBL5_NOMLE
MEGEQGEDGKTAAGPGRSTSWSGRSRAWALGRLWRRIPPHWRHPRSSPSPRPKLVRAHRPLRHLWGAAPGLASVFAPGSASPCNPASRARASPRPLVHPCGLRLASRCSHFIG